MPSTCSLSSVACATPSCLHGQAAGLSNFAWGHHCSRQDTLSGLAVKYGVTPLAIKMTNNLISDQGLQSRHIIYVPGQPANMHFVPVMTQIVVRLLHVPSQ